tara:strand:+ start:821 stop:1627 length:807 start_codon:yes stop_codon:yes gene_type:complete
MAQILTSFGFHTRNVTDTDTNTNLGNSDLTSSGTRTFDTNGETLTFQDSTNELFQINVDEITFGSTTAGCNINFKNGNAAPDLRLFEASGSGSNYVTLTCGALATNTTITFPNSTGTAALLEARQTFTGRSIIELREFAVTTSTLGDVIGDVMYTGTGSVQSGKIYYWDGSAWSPADASAASTGSGMLGVALGTGATNSVGICIRGMVTIGNNSGSNGDVIYLSETLTQATNTAPTTSGAIVRVIGYCLDSTNNQIYFNPDGTWVENA